MKTLRKAHSEVKPLSDLARAKRIDFKKKLCRSSAVTSRCGGREGRQREGGEVWGWELDFLVMITTVV